MKVPVINALKPYKQHFDAKYFLNLPTNSPFGNLTLTYSEIVVCVECLNQLIEDLYSGFLSHNALVKSRGGWATLDEGFKHKFQIEEVIYWLHKVADQCISIGYILDYKQTTHNFPVKINISCIGDFLKSNGELKRKLLKHQKILNIINNVSNAYKHSIINAQVTAYRGIAEPVVFAYSLLYNDLKNIPSYHSINLTAIIEAFDNFLLDYKDFVQKTIDQISAG